MQLAWVRKDRHRCFALNCLRQWVEKTVKEMIKYRLGLEINNTLLDKGWSSAAAAVHKSLHGAVWLTPVMS